MGGRAGFWGKAPRLIPEIKARPTTTLTTPEPTPARLADHNAKSLNGAHTKQTPDSTTSRDNRTARSKTTNTNTTSNTNTNGKHNKPPPTRMRPERQQPAAGTGQDARGGHRRGKGAPCAGLVPLPLRRRGETALQSKAQRRRWHENNTANVGDKEKAGNYLHEDFGVRERERGTGFVREAATDARAAGGARDNCCSSDPNRPWGTDPKLPPAGGGGGESHHQHHKSVYGNSNFFSNLSYI